MVKRNDKRITKVGNLLRIMRLDELPQLISVLKGEMSLIGPRPERPEIDQTLTEKYPSMNTVILFGLVYQDGHKLITHMELQ